MGKDSTKLTSVLEGLKQCLKLPFIVEDTVVDWECLLCKNGDTPWTRVKILQKSKNFSCQVEPPLASKRGKMIADHRNNQRKCMSIDSKTFILPN